MKKMMIFGIVLGAMTAGSCTNNIEGVYSVKTGKIQIFTLVESERNGNAGILVGADDTILSRYIPAEGFKHTANAFLIKTPRHLILADTGTGSGGVIIEKIKALGFKPEDINAVLITHLHGDHFGSLQKEGKAVFPNAKVYLSARELEYFTRTNVNEGAAAALAPYREKSQIEAFEPGELEALFKGQVLNEILPGITPIAAYGHTPGHTIYLIESDKAKLLIIGDLLHVALVQFPVPEISATYDMNQKEAAIIRRQVLDYAAANKIPVAGMHIVYPAAGSVAADGTGFKFTPAK